MFAQPTPVMSGPGAGRYVPTPQGPHGAMLRAPSADAMPPSARAPSPGPMVPVPVGTFPAGPAPGGALFRAPSLEGPRSRAASPAPLQQVTIGTFPPAMAPPGSSIRAPSREGTGLLPGSRGASPGRQAVLIPVQMVPAHMAPMAPIASPQMMPRSGSVGPGAPHPIDSARGSFNAFPPRQQQGRPASRSPPPQRGNMRAISTPREPIAVGTPQAGMGPPAPANTPRMVPVQVPTMPIPLQQTRGIPAGATPGTPHSGRAHSVAPSPQGAMFMHTPTHSDAARRLSMPSAGAVATTPGLQTPMRSASTSGMPVGHGVAVPPFATMEATTQPPWAQVVRPPAQPTAREQEQQERDRKLLQTILSEVRTMSQCLADGSEPPKTEGESVLCDVQDLKEKVNEKDKRLIELNNALQKALEELAGKESRINSFEQDVKAVQSEKEKLEADMKRRSDAKDEAAERIAQRCADHERRNAELMSKLAEKETALINLQAEKERAESAQREAETRLQESESARRQLEGDRRSVEAELKRLQEQAERHHAVEQETRELRCRVAVLEDTLHDAQDKQRAAERASDAAERARQTAEQEVAALHERILQEEKKSVPSHHRALWEAEEALVREQNAACLRSPGDFLRVMNYFATRENLAYENDRLQMELSDLQHQNRELRAMLQPGAGGA